MLDAPPPPFAEPRSDSGYLSGAGAAQPGFKWGIQVPTDPGDAAVDAGSGDPRSSFSFAAVCFPLFCFPFMSLCGSVRSWCVLCLYMIYSRCEGVQGLTT